MAAVLSAAMVVSLLQIAVSPRSAVSHADASTGSGGQFVPVSGRILDTRSASKVGPYSTPMPAGTWRSIAVAGQAGLPASGIAAVAVNFSVFSPSAKGILKADKDEATPNTTISYMNFDAGVDSSGSAVLAVGTDGKIQAEANASTDLVVDVQGYYTAGDPGAGGYVPVDPARVVDTRYGIGLPQAQLASGSTTTINVGGQAGVPTDASAVMVDFLVDNQTGSGHITPYPADQSLPATSLRYLASGRDTISAQVGLGGTGGAFKVYQYGHSLDLVVDVVGYFTASDDSGASFTPAAARVFDSGVAPNTTIAPNTTATVQVAGVAGLPSTGLSAVTADFSVNDISGSTDSYIRVWDDFADEPATTALYYHAGDTRSNLVTSAVGVDGAIEVRNHGTDPISVVVDVEGWYSSTSSSSAATLVSGTVTGSSGTPEAATLTVLAWPNTYTSTTLEPGDEIPTDTVGTATTAADGSYSISADLNDLPAKDIEPNGSVSMELDADLADGTDQETDFTAAIPGTAAASDTDVPNAVQGAAPESAAFKTDAQSVSQSVGTGLAVSVDQPTSVNVSGDQLSSDTDPDAFVPDIPLPTGTLCSSWYLQAAYPTRSEKFNNLYSVGSATVDESDGSSHTLGIALKVGAGGWSISADRTKTISVQGGETDTYSGNRQIYNTVNYEKDEKTCQHVVMGFVDKTWHKHKLRPGSFHGLQTNAVKIKPRKWDLQNCDWHPGGTSGAPYKQHGSDLVFSAGVDSPVGGLSAQAEYSDQFTVTWNVPSQGEYMCGNNYKGFQSAPFGGGASANDLNPIQCSVGTYIQTDSLNDGDDAQIDDGFEPDC